MNLVLSDGTTHSVAIVTCLYDPDNLDQEDKIIICHTDDHSESEVESVRETLTPENLSSVKIISEDYELEMNLSELMDTCLLKIFLLPN